MTKAVYALNAVGITLKKYSEGEQRAACPKCAIEKQRAHDDALAVLIDDKGVTWFCHRCRWRSGVRTEAHQARPVANGTKGSRNRELAASIWSESRAALGTIVDAYLQGRGITCPTPECIRIHSHCPRGAEKLPAMVAAMVDIRSNELSGIHRTFLKRDGSGKAGGKAKMMLGPSAGAVIKLTHDDEVEQGLAICEGIETGLSLVSAGFQVWACGCAGDIKTFPILSGIDWLTIFADADDAGMTAARECAKRWSGDGRQVRILSPQIHGYDWNDFARVA